jgi:hypothetical protein
MWYRGAVSTADDRRRARANLPGRLLRLGQEPSTDERDTSTVDERLALVATLTSELWAFTGLPIPDYTRDNMPGKVSRRQ